MIQLYDVSKRYENGRDALVDVSLRVREGEFLFLTGASGAGKSTLLRLLLVMERVTEGQILIGGRNVHLLRDASVPFFRRNIGMVFQDFRLIDRRNVYDNVAIAMEVLGWPRTRIEPAVMKLLGDMGLSDRARAMPADLSGGERQRVAIARALANEPTILLADEPTGNLDLKLSIEIMDLLGEINSRGTTVVVATHDYSLVERYGLRTVHLQDSRVASDRPRTKLDAPGQPGLGGGGEPYAMPVMRPVAGPLMHRGPAPLTGPLAQPIKPLASIPRPTGRIQPGQIAPPRRATTGFSAANVRIPAARITGPVRPDMVMRVREDDRDAADASEPEGDVSDSADRGPDA